MKILYLTNVIPWPVNNGKKMRIMAFLKSLNENHNIDLICLNAESLNEGSYDEIFQYIRRIAVIQLSAKLMKGSAIDRIKYLFSSLPYSVIRFESNSMKDKIREFIDSSQYDCLICDGVHTSVNLTNTKNALLILNEHNIEYIILERYIEQERNIFKKLYAKLELNKLRAFEKNAWNYFNYCIVCSEVDKQVIEECNNNEVVIVIPNTIEVNKYQFEPNEISYNIAFLGVLDWIPNQDAVHFFYEEIYHLIKERIPEVSFTIIGRNPTNRIMELAASDYSIKITGTVNDIKPFLSQCQILVVPLRIGSGTRLKILEAMAMKKPVVSTSVGAEGIDISDGKNIAIADDPISFAGKVIELLRNPKLRAYIADNGYELVLKKYDISVIKHQFSTIFSSKDS